MERRILIGCGAVGLTLLLVGAAFVGGWLLGSSDLTAGNQDAITSDSDGEVLARPGVRIEIKPAAGMPDQPVDAGGLLVRQEGSSLFLGTGRLSGVLVRDEARGTAQWELQHDGPVVEVFTTHETRFYRDDTLQHLPTGSTAGPVQQVLTPSTLGEIEEHSTISVWGERRGDRLVAGMVVCYPNGLPR
jgi:hypothetical protein